MQQRTCSVKTACFCNNSVSIQDSKNVVQLLIILKEEDLQMKEFFSYDDRLGIHIPNFDSEWDFFKLDTQHSIMFHWETIRGSIPDRIADLENSINIKQTQLSEENDFHRSCELNAEIAELASIINDLWILYREHQEISDKVLQ
jgi:hypothetical protein